MSEQITPELRRFNHIGFSQYLAERRLMAARCTHCGAVHLPPRPLCPHCYHAAMEWVELSGEGWLEGFTVIHVGLPGMIAQGYNRENPYCSGVVRLAEGPAMTGQIFSATGAIPVHIQVGTPLHAIFIEQGDPVQVALAFQVNQ